MYGRAAVLVEANDKVRVPPFVGTGMVGAPVTSAAVVAGARRRDDRSRHRREGTVAHEFELVPGGLQSGTVAPDSRVLTEDGPNRMRIVVLTHDP